MNRELFSKHVYLPLVGFWLFINATACAPSDNYLKLYKPEPYAPSFQVADIKNLEHMGSKLVDDGVNFAVYSEKASRIELLIFDDPEGEYPSQVFEMSRFGNVFNIYVSGLTEGTYYAYRAWGPNWTYDPSWYAGSLIGFKADYDTNGNRFNPNKALMDPYARAYHRKHDWAKGMAASGPYRQESTMAAAAKSIVLNDDNYAWSATEQQYWSNKQNINNRPGREKIIKYEVNLKGLSMGAASGIPGLTEQVKYPGTYRGAGELAPYLAELGITAVEFLPVHESGSDGGYWKYWTIGFFAPEYEYAYEPQEGSQVNEFRWMVEQFHKYSIRVIIDVVYNHTGEGGLWREKVPLIEGNNPTDPDNPNHFWSYDPPETATMLSFRGLDNYAYYALTGPNKEFYYDHTGTGNMVRTAHAPGRKLVIDSLRYWVEKMHVDGFRFDLAEVLEKKDGQEDGNWNKYPALLDWAETDTRATSAASLWAVNDAVLMQYDTALVAEPWSIGGYRFGEFPRSACFDTSWTAPTPDGGGSCADSKYQYYNGFAWYEWSDLFKKFSRKFINVDDQKLDSDLGLGEALTGTPSKFNESGDKRKPYHNINKITAHDGFTMYDVLSYNQKRNGIGPLNPEGVDPYSGDSSQNFSRDWGSDEELKRQLHRNLMTLLLISNGTPMLLGGDEWMRTQYGNNNSYTEGSDNQYNWFRWGVWVNDSAAYRMYDFTKKLIKFRKDHCYAFCRTEYETDDSSANDMFDWWWRDGSGGAEWSSESVAQYYKNTGSDPKLFIIINMEENETSYTLPAGITWRRAIDTQKFFEGFSSTESGNVFNDTTAYTNYTAAARSIVIFKEVQ